MANIKTIREQLVDEFYDFNVSADITIESLADVVMNIMKDLQGEAYVKEFHQCPICTDCPDGCPLVTDAFVNKKFPMSIHADGTINAIEKCKTHIRNDKGKN